MDEIDPKAFIAKTHQNVAAHREVEVAFEYGGFSDVNLVPVWRAEDPYWMLYASAMGDQAKVEAQARTLLRDLGLYVIEMKGAQNYQYWTVYISIPMEQIDEKSVAESIVSKLLEDIDADLPSHKSEVRILATDDPRRFDVTLLTGFDPIYIGTLGHQGSLWKPVEVMAGIGREMRAKLHFVGPDKEAVAMTLVQALRPFWKRKVSDHLASRMESEEIDPKAFVQKKLSYDTDIKRVIETNYPNIEVVSVTNMTGDSYRVRFDAQIRSRDPGQPLWHQPIYSLIQDIEVKLADSYGWKLRPYMNQQNYPEHRRTGRLIGIKPISICYENSGTGKPGEFVLHIDFEIFRRTMTGRGDFEPQADWGTPYGTPGEQQRESLETEITKEAEKAEKPTSPEQAEAGNYRKGHVSVQGLEIAIENAEGSTRSGTGKDGKTWKVTMPAHYGYIKGTQGKDKDHLDVYIGPKPGGMMAFVVNQQKEDTKGFDEHKIMLGFATKDEAIETYDRAFSGDLGPKLRQSVVSTTVDKLKEWIASGNTKKPFGGLAESLLEADDENGFKSLAMRASQGAAPGTEFHIGFAISTSDEHMIQQRANDDAAEVDWAAINDAIPIIERNAITVLGEQGIQCREEGHDGDGDLIGSAWVKAGTEGTRIVQMFIDAGEPFRTSSGTIDFIQQGLALRLYQGVPPEIASLIDVDISFFDHDEMENPDPLAESDTKALAMRIPMRDPQVWGELKVGDVLYVPETGSYERIDAIKSGYGSSYQGADGKMVYNSGPAQFRWFSQFGPAYAYGHYIQRLSAHPMQGLLGAQLVELPDTSDAALWKLVDEEIISDGRTTPEELQASRDQHNAWLARPEQQAAREARARINQMMGVPEPPVDESEEIDTKGLALRSTKGLSPDQLVVFQCPFTDVGDVTRPNYFSTEIGDWQRDWNLADRDPIGKYIKNGVLDMNDLPFGCESVILVNPDGSPGPEYSVEDLNFGTAQVIDTYVDPEVGRYGGGD